MCEKREGFSEAHDLGNGLGKPGERGLEREKATYKWGKGATAG